jgi:hypothetical protein
MKYVNHVITPRSITLIYNDGKDRVATVQSSDTERYQAAVEAVKTGKLDALLNINDPRVATCQNTPLPKESKISQVMSSENRKVRGAANVLTATTDRVTIPAVIMLEAGFRSNDELSVFITDKRSRFLLICPARYLKRFSKDHKCVDSVTVKSLSTGSVSLRAPTMSMAKIWPTKTTERLYRVRIMSRNLVEIRLNSASYR